jgi:hypothetical protein
MRALALAMLLAMACGGSAPGPRLALTVAALDGGDLDLARYRGRVVVLHLFTTWDLGAQVDLLQLEAAAARKDVAVIGVALDPEGYELVAPWRTGSEVTYQLALADDAIRSGTSPLGTIDVVPTTIVLDRQGRIAARVPRALAAGELATLIDRASARGSD